MRQAQLTVELTTAFRKDYKLAMKRGLDINLLDAVIEMLAMRKVLPKRCKDHDLMGNWKGYCECHVSSDWLLIYRIEAEVLVLTLFHTGTLQRLI